MSENTVKRLLDKLQSFVHHKSENQQFISFEDKNPDLLVKSMKVGTCSCSANYIGETKKTMSRHSRMNYKDPNKDSEAAKHLRDFLDHKFH